ncbi:DUF7260 family protein [Halomarina pelagica]|uniref:DUF7260 family protein n=1 Tax=Halomarina pelagica TaxID=2961599 RepID=UPI0020C339EF|nr:hypothetical protein [Halomarina sp. BND7]
MHRHLLAPIETARTLLDEEYEQVRVEQAAFETFAGRIRALDPEPERSRALCTVPSPRDRSLADLGSASTTREVRTAYRETVMGVEHYDRVYDESLATNLAAEVGSELAAVVREDGPLTVTVQRAIVAGADRAIRDRRAFLDALEAERDSLAGAHHEGRELTAGLARLGDSETATSTERVAVAEAVDDLLERCRRLIDARQRHVQERSIARYLDGHDLCTYLYAAGPGDWTYPVLTVTVSLYRDLTAVRSRLERR